MIDNRQKNRLAVEDLLKKNPTAGFIYFKRHTDGYVVDIPISHVPMTIKVNPAWTVVTSNKQMDSEIEALFLDSPEPESLDVPALPTEQEVQTARQTLYNAPGQEFTTETTLPTTQPKKQLKKASKAKK